MTPGWQYRIDHGRKVYGFLSCKEPKVKRSEFNLQERYVSSLRWLCRQSAAQYALGLHPNFERSTKRNTSGLSWEVFLFGAPIQIRTRPHPYHECSALKNLRPTSSCCASPVLTYGIRSAPPCLLSLYCSLFASLALPAERNIYALGLSSFLYAISKKKEDIVTDILFLFGAPIQIRTGDLILTMDAI